MALLPTQPIDDPPIEYTAASGGGDTYAWSPGTFLHVKNGSVADKTVTVAGQTPCSQGFLHNVDHVVPASGELFIEPQDGSYADGSELIHLTYSAVTSVTLAALTLS